jgi:Putative peptidoglycan binding domain
MKTHKVLLLALVVSAVLPVSVQADKHQGNSESEAAPAPAQGAAPTARSASGSQFSGGRMIAPSQRFSSNGMRSLPAGSRQHYISSSGGNRESHVGSIGNGNRRLAGASNHVFAQHSADSHRDWDRRSDHWWHGHRCHFFNGSWFIFDLGFIPWYGYPYDYYADDYYYPYGYDPGVYQGADANDYGQGPYNSSDQNTDSPVAAAQERLARQGYYHGGIDGVFGPATRHAIMRYQSTHGLRATGYLTMDTLQSLGLRRAASY